MKLFIWENIFCDSVFCGMAIAYANNIEEAKSLLLEKAKLEGVSTVKEIKEEIEKTSPIIFDNIPYAEYFYGS